MRYLINLLFILCTGFIPVKAQDVILWEKNYGGTAQFESVLGIETYKNSGYVICGTTDSENYDFPNNHGGNDACLIKTDMTGTKIWSKNYGSNYDDAFLCTKTDKAGFIYSVGYSSNDNGEVSVNYGNADVWVVKTDSMGTIIWEKSFGGSASDAGFDFVFAPDSSLMVIALTSSSNGIVAGSGYSGGQDVWVLRLDRANGNVLWKKCYGTSDDEGYAMNLSSVPVKNVSIATHGDGVFTIATAQSGLSYDIWVFSIDLTGTILFSEGYDGTLADFPRQIQPTPDGGYVVCANTHSTDGDISSNHGYSDGWILKLNNSLLLEWEKTIGGTNYEECSDIAVTSNGYYVVGRSDSWNGDCPANYGQHDVMLYFVSLGGNVWWSRNFGTTETNIGEAVHIAPNGNVLVGGYSRGINYDVLNNYGLYDLWLFEYGDISSNGYTVVKPMNVVPFPNPTQNFLCFSEELKISSVSFFDVSGRLITNHVSFENCFPVSSFETGIYTFILKTESGETCSGKFIKN